MAPQGKTQKKKESRKKSRKEPKKESTKEPNKVLRISTKRSSLKKVIKKNPAMKEWVNKNGPTSDLIDWYLRETQSRYWLEDYRSQLEREYLYDIDGNIRIKWNHLNGLLINGTAMDDSIKEQFFRSFLYAGTRSIKKISFLKGPDGSFEPSSIIVS